MSKVVAVGELTRYLANLISEDRALRNLAVKGEISNFKQYASGHCYFNLKDAQGIIPCVMFRSSASRLRFRPEDGMAVIAAGSVNVYVEGGRYQLYVNDMLPDGVGDLAMAFEQLKARLSQEGLFDQEHKKPLPIYPATIGIVTSSSGAVLRDIYRVSKRRFPGIRLVLKPVQVQGTGAAEQIAQAVDFFNAHYLVDVLIVGRGGGSLEDLWAFNEEVVVRAIYNSAIPVISAVGHETDFTLADFVADERAATPSQAAEMAVRDGQEIAAQLLSLQTRLRNSAVQQLDIRRKGIVHLLTRPVMENPHLMLEQRMERLDNLAARLGQSGSQQLKQQVQHLTHLMDKLELMNPMNTLRRGYGMVRSKDNRVIATIQEVQAGDRIQVELQDGIIHAQAVALEEV